MTYYDFRQAGTATYRPTDLWLAVSGDGAVWRETRRVGNFDLLDAPNASGVDGAAIAAGGTGLDGKARKSAAPVWTRSAEARVGQHLSSVRAANRAQWRAWREAGSWPVPQ
ncbi:MAG: hypothetical protein WCF43_05550 [Steroidobacteraceae bacterium]